MSFGVVGPKTAMVLGAKTRSWCCSPKKKTESKSTKHRTKKTHNTLRTRKHLASQLKDVLDATRVEFERLLWISLTHCGENGGEMNDPVDSVLFERRKRRRECEQE